MKGQMVLISYDTTYLCGTQEYNYKHVSNCDSYMESIQSYVFGEQQIGKEGHCGKMWKKSFRFLKIATSYKM